MRLHLHPGTPVPVVKNDRFLLTIFLQHLNILSTKQGYNGSHRPVPSGSVSTRVFSLVLSESAKKGWNFAGNPSISMIVEVASQNLAGGLGLFP